MLPSYFEWEEYGNCIKNENEYCKIQGTLQVPTSNSLLFNIFEERKDNEHFLDPSVFYRAICVNKQEILQKNSTIDDYISGKISTKFQNYNILAKVEKYFCTDGKLHINNYDVFIMIGVVLYSILILHASFYSKTEGNEGTNNFLSHFSFRKHWKNKTDVSKIKLLHLNSFRFYLMMVVILIHMVLQWNTYYVENPSYFGNTYMKHPLSIYYRKLFSFIVLGFFMISSWLATTRLYNIVEDRGELSLKHVGIILINRYFRYIAAPIFILVSISNWKYLVSGPVNFDISYQSDEICKNNWLSSILCFSNFYNLGDICNLHTWFISADFQFYIINVLLHYVIFKYKLNKIRMYGIIFVLSCCLHGYMLYCHNMGTGFTPSTRNIAAYHVSKSKSILICYLSSYANASSSLVGVIMGYIYFKYEKKHFSLNLSLSWLWKILSIILPIATIYLSAGQGTKLYEAFLGSISRPMFTLSFGIVLLGISFNLGGALKKVLENKVTVILGNFSFSIYVCHFIFCQYSHVSVFPRMSIFVLVLDYLKVLAVSILGGIILCLTIEEPCSSLQAKMLPQIIKHQNKTRKSHEN